MAALRYSQRFFRGATHLDAHERAALQRTLRAMEAVETLPTPDDAQTILPPSMRAFRRRIGTSNRYVYFTVGDGGRDAVIVAVGGYL